MRGLAALTKLLFLHAVLLSSSCLRLFCRRRSTVGIKMSRRRQRRRFASSSARRYSLTRVLSTTGAKRSPVSVAANRVLFIERRGRAATNQRSNLTR